MSRKKKDSSTLDLSGVWYNPEKSGWGVLIQNHGEDTHSVAIYTYDERGNQVWLVGAGNRGDGFFTLTSPKATGFMDTIRNKAERDAGLIEFDLVAPGKISYKAKIKSEIVYPAPQFSPPPPATLEFEGVLTKLG